MFLECHPESTGGKIRFRTTGFAGVLSAWRLHGRGHFLAPPIRDAVVSRSGSHLTVRFEDNECTRVSLEELQPGGPATLLLHGIGQLLVRDGKNRFMVVGDAAVLMRHDRILAAGPADQVLSHPALDGSSPATVDAGGAVVSPGLIDPHTHPVFATHRAREFAMRKAGATYAEIQAAGGGILSTMRTTRAAPEEELFESAARRLARMLRFGVTSIEGKSGYALDEAGELKMLRVLNRLSDRTAVGVSPTLLAAHTVPPEYADCRGEYVRMIVEKLIPQSRDLAVSCDVFCENGAFTLEETTAILKAAVAAGLQVRVHAGQFNSLGAVSVAARLGALSVDHLEEVSEAELEDLAKSGNTTAVLLPGAALSLGLPMPSGRAFLDRGIPVAVGTDCNPGTSMSENLPLAGTLACMQMGLSVEETWDAMTVFAARAAGFPDRGTLAPGQSADLVIWDFDHFGVLPYHFGVSHARRIFRQGIEVQLESE